MTNAFTAKPKVSAFLADLQRNRVKAAHAAKTAQRHNFPQNEGMRAFTQAEREGKGKHHE